MVTHQIIQNRTKPNRNIAKLDETKLDNTKIGINGVFLKLQARDLAW